MEEVGFSNHNPNLRPAGVNKLAAKTGTMWRAGHFESQYEKLPRQANDKKQSQVHHARNSQSTLTFPAFHFDFF